MRDGRAGIVSRTDNSISMPFWSSFVLVLGPGMTALFGCAEATGGAWSLLLLAGAVLLVASGLWIARTGHRAR